VVKCPAAALGIEPGQADTVKVQFERQRSRRENVGAKNYHWMAPMRPPWLQHFRFGRLEM
jgi:hypothetical protein